MAQPWKSKFRNQPVVTDEGRFASKKEYARWCHLKLREKAGEISKLERQVRFALEINGTKICTYIADAVFFEGQRRVVEDVKGVITPEFRLKQKLMKAILNIDVETV
jgi:hypothetical protein